MRDPETIQRELTGAQHHLEDDVAALKEAVRYELDPAHNAQRVVRLAETEARGLLSHLWAFLVELWHRLRVMARQVLAPA